MRYVCHSCGDKIYVPITTTYRILKECDNTDCSECGTETIFLRWIDWWIADKVRNNG